MTTPRPQRPEQHWSPSQAPPPAQAPMGGRNGSQHSSTASLPQAYVMAPPPPDYRAGPRVKTWSDEEGMGKGAGQGPSFCTKFKFAIWLGVVVLLVGAVVGLSVTMALVTDNNDSGAPKPPSPPPAPGGGGDEGGGGDGSGGNGNTGPLPTPDTTPDWVPAGQQAIWWDDFDGDSLDTNKWSYDLGNGDWGWGNNELQTYTDSAANVRVADGNLYITADRDGDGYTSGRINTKQHASFWPGMQLQDGSSFTSVHVEARIKLPEPGKGLWPAFWLFPTELKYGKWAASGEIDVMESVNDLNRITQGLHYGGADPQNQKSMVRTPSSGSAPWGTFSDDYHTYAVDWELGKITLSVDGKVAKTYLPREKDPEGGWWTEAAGAGPDAPFDEPFYIIMNLAVGGLWPGEPDNDTPFPATLLVDYVRVWGTPL